MNDNLSREKYFELMKSWNLPAESSVYANGNCMFTYDSLPNCIDSSLHMLDMRRRFWCNKIRYFYEVVIMVSKDKQALIFAYADPTNMAAISHNLLTNPDLLPFVDNEVGKHRFILAVQGEDGRFYIYG